MNQWLAIAALTGGFAAHAADPQAVWDQAIQAKGGRERLHHVHSLAVYLKPAEVNLAGPPTTWLFVFPDRYFEFARTSSASRAIVVDATTNRVAMDATGIPRAKRNLNAGERDRLILNQVLFLLESAWLQPRPLEVRHNAVTIEAAGHTFRVFLDHANLPERVEALSLSGKKSKTVDTYRLQHYRDFQGVQLPSRIIEVMNIREWTWDADYEVDAKYNPKLFERMPDLANGPEPWRLR